MGKSRIKSPPNPKRKLKIDKMQKVKSNQNDPPVEQS
jgi:hypothetical protein